MGYNEKGHKEPLVVSGAGERPAKSLLTSPVYVFPDCAPLWRAVTHLAYQYAKKSARRNMRAIYPLAVAQQQAGASAPHGAARR